MSEFVLCAEPGANLFCVWSTAVDAPTVIGTGDAIVGHLTEHRFDAGHTCRAIPIEIAEGMIERAKQTGSSVKHRYGAGAIPGSWEDEDLIFEQRGSLPRTRLPEVLRRYLDAPEDAEEDPDISDLLIPFDDHDDPPEPAEYNPGPEVDDEGGMSEFRRAFPDDRNPIEAVGEPYGFDA